MKVELNKQYIESLIEKVEYKYSGTATSCYLTVGLAIVVGTSIPYDHEKYDKTIGEESAYEEAINQLFILEAYHLKRNETKGE